MENNEDHKNTSHSSKDFIIPLRLILPITSIGVFMGAMDGSIVNVSLKTIATDLDTDMGGIRWIVIVYLLVISSLIGIGGSIGDNYGRKKVFQFGMALFALGSLLCAFSSSLIFLILSRILQAVGAAGLMANGLALVITYIDPSIRGRAIGINSLVVASALSTGPALGGFLSEFVGWPSIFLINIPIGFIGILLVQKYIPETPQKTDVNLDYRGMVIFIITAFSFVSGILFLFEGNFLGGFLLGVALFSGFVFVFIEISHPQPMISIRLMKDKTILFGVLASLLCYMSYYALVFLLPFFYQDVIFFTHAHKQSITGILMIIPPLFMGTFGPIGGLLSEKINLRKLTTIGALLLGFSIIVLSFSIDQSLIIILPLIALSAGFLAIFTSSNGTSVMNASPKANISIVSGLIGLSRNIGFALGTTLSSALFGLFFSSNNPTNVTSGPIFLTSYYSSLGATFFIFALFSFIGAFLSRLRD
ncbi:MAG: MFS transporter [Candidatus Hermodarchaeota archaeon]